MFLVESHIFFKLKFWLNIVTNLFLSSGVYFCSLFQRILDIMSAHASTWQEDQNNDRGTTSLSSLLRFFVAMFILNQVWKNYSLFLTSKFRIHVIL